MREGPAQTSIISLSQHLTTYGNDADFVVIDLLDVVQTQRLQSGSDVTGGAADSEDDKQPGDNGARDPEPRFAMKLRDAFYSLCFRAEPFVQKYKIKTSDFLCLHLPAVSFQRFSNKKIIHFKPKRRKSKNRPRVFNNILNMADISSVRKTKQQATWRYSSATEAENPNASITLYLGLPADLNQWHARHTQLDRKIVRREVIPGHYPVILNHIGAGSPHSSPPSPFSVTWLSSCVIPRVPRGSGASKGIGFGAWFRLVNIGNNSPKRPDVSAAVTIDSVTK